MLPTLRESDISLVYAGSLGTFAYFQQEEDADGNFGIFESQNQTGTWDKPTPVATDAVQGTSITSYFIYGHNDGDEIHVLYFNKVGKLVDRYRDIKTGNWVLGLEKPLSTPPVIPALGAATPPFYVPGSPPVAHPNQQWAFFTAIDHHEVRSLYRSDAGHPDFEVATIGGDIETFYAPTKLSVTQNVDALRVFVQAGDGSIVQYTGQYESYPDKGVTGWTQSTWLTNPGLKYARKRTPIAAASTWEGDLSVFVSDGRKILHILASPGGSGDDAKISELVPYDNAYETRIAAVCAPDYAKGETITLAYHAPEEGREGAIATRIWHAKEGKWEAGPHITSE